MRGVEEGDVVHVHRRLLGGAGRHRPLGDERVHGGLHRGEVAQEVVEQVQDVRAHVVERAAARHVPAQAPRERLVGADVAGAIVAAAEGEDPPQEALVDELFRAQDSRVEAEVEGHLRLHAGLLHGGHHALALGHRHGEGLLAVDVLAGRGRRGDDGLVGVVGHAHVHHVHVRPGQQLVIVGRPARRSRSPAPPAARSGARGRHADDLHRLRREAVEEGDVAIGERVDPPDAAVTDQRNADWFHDGCFASRLGLARWKELTQRRKGAEKRKEKPGGSLRFSAPLRLCVRFCICPRWQLSREIYFLRKPSAPRY